MLKKFKTLVKCHAEKSLALFLGVASTTKETQWNELVVLAKAWNLDAKPNHLNILSWCASKGFCRRGQVMLNLLVNHRPDSELGDDGCRPAFAQTTSETASRVVEFMAQQKGWKWV